VPGFPEYANDDDDWAATLKRATHMET
jgi:hypothetical protein